MVESGSMGVEFREGNDEQGDKGSFGGGKDGVQPHIDRVVPSTNGEARPLWKKLLPLNEPVKPPVQLPNIPQSPHTIGDVAWMTDKLYPEYMLDREPLDAAYRLATDFHKKDPHCYKTTEQHFGVAEIEGSSVTSVTFSQSVDTATPLQSVTLWGTEDNRPYVIREIQREPNTNIVRIRTESVTDDEINRGIGIFPEYGQNRYEERARALERVDTADDTLDIMTEGELVGYLTQIQQGLAQFWPEGRVMPRTHGTDTTVTEETGALLGNVVQTLATAENHWNSTMDNIADAAWDVTTVGNGTRPEVVTVKRHTTHRRDDLVVIKTTENFVYEKDDFQFWTERVIHPDTYDLIPRDDPQIRSVIKELARDMDKDAEMQEEQEKVMQDLGITYLQQLDAAMTAPASS